MVAQNKKPGDLILHVESLEYCTKTAIIRNGTATTRTISNIVGYPLKAGASGADYQLAVATDEASVIALLVDGPAPETIANATNSPSKWQVLHRAPCIINQSAIATLDIAGAALTVATIVTALKALNFEVRNIPVKSTLLA